MAGKKTPKNLLITGPKIGGGRVSKRLTKKPLFHISLKLSLNI